MKGAWTGAGPAWAVVVGGIWFQAQAVAHVREK